MTSTNIVLLGVLALGLPQQPEFANPRYQTFDALQESVYASALKAGSGHKVEFNADEGLKELDDAGRDVDHFAFTVILSAFPEPVVADVRVYVDSDDGSRSKLRLYFHKLHQAYLDSPSESFQLRRAQLVNKMNAQLALAANEGEELDFLHENGKMDDVTYTKNKVELVKIKAQIQIEEVNQESAARLTDMAQLPTKIFPSLDDYAQHYIAMVQKHLHEKTTGVGVPTPPPH